jgi:hypothetical protein
MIQELHFNFDFHYGIITDRVFVLVLRTNNYGPESANAARPGPTFTRV